MYTAMMPGGTSVVPWRKYNLVRSQSLHQNNGLAAVYQSTYHPIETEESGGSYRVFALAAANGQGQVRPLSYRSLDEELPPKLQNARTETQFTEGVVAGKPPLPRSQFVSQRGGSFRRPRASFYRTREPEEFSEEAGERETSNQNDTRVKPLPASVRKRIPMDLLDKLPESRVDTEPEVRHREDNASKDVSYSGNLGITVRVRAPEPSRGSSTPPLPSPPLDNLDEPLPPPPPPLDLCLSEDKRQDGRSLGESLSSFSSSHQRHQQHQARIVKTNESVLCQESSRGTVFGLVRTPTLTRRADVVDSPPSLDNRGNGYHSDYEEVFLDNDYDNRKIVPYNRSSSHESDTNHRGRSKFPNNQYVSPLQNGYYGGVSRHSGKKSGVTVINFGGVDENGYLYSEQNRRDSEKISRPLECFNTNVKVQSPLSKIDVKTYDLSNVRETVNPQLRASFCRTMLTEIQASQAATLKLGSNQNNRNALSGTARDSPATGKGTADTSVKWEVTPKSSVPANSTARTPPKNIVPWSPDESPEVIEAMEHLDKSIEEGEVSSTDTTLVNGSQTSVKSPVDSNIVPKSVNGQPDASHESDNLIEEVVLPGPNKRSYVSLAMTNSKDNGVDNDSSKNDAASSNGSIDGAVVPKLSGGESETEEMVSGTSTPNKKNNYFVVVAIDFGTTYSGYAFSFIRDPEKIHMMRKWEGGDPGVLNQKTPTTLLLTAEGLFHSFGFAARDFYHNLEPDEAKKWLFFEKFKMTLHYSEDLCRDTVIKAANGKTQPAFAVFAHALRYFKEHALQELSDQSATRILNEDVRWVVTVPAIWRQPAKQFMRTAAYDAGIASPETADQLLIALEPEAASIYCRQLRLHQLVESPPLFKLFTRKATSEITEANSKPVVEQTREEQSDANLPKSHPRSAVQNSLSRGTRYMVVDCGGGTVDITVHELLDDGGSLKELHKAVGGPHGSVGVDVEFEKLLVDIFGTDFLEQFKVKRSVGFIDLMVAFEARKRNASPYNIMPLNVSLPFSFIDFYKKTKGSSVENAIRKFGNKEVTWSSQGMLRLEPSLMNKLFQPTVQCIKQCIADVLASPQVNGVTYLFLVGGFAESQILQKEVREAFSPYVRVIIPQGVSLAILTGAVLFGLDPTVVNIRRSRLTYGVGVLNRFIHGVHPQEKLVVKDGIEWCADIFDKFVLADQSVGLGEAVLRSYTPAKLGQTCTILHIYCSERHDAKFITNTGVHRCGSLSLDLADTKYSNQVPRRREIQTRMIFGDTEIKVSALDVSTGKCVKAEIDFLNQ